MDAAPHDSPRTCGVFVTFSCIWIPLFAVPRPDLLLNISLFKGRYDKSYKETYLSLRSSVPCSPPTVLLCSRAAMADKSRAQTICL